MIFNAFLSNRSENQYYTDKINKLCASISRLEKSKSLKMSIIE